MPEPFDDPRLLGNELVSATMLTDPDRLHPIFRRLRALNRPVWVTPDDYRPFWAVTSHAHVQQASQDHVTFINSRRNTLLNRAQEAAAIKGAAKYARVLRSLIHMDEPDHPKYRAVGQSWFNGSALKKMAPTLDALSVEFTDRLLVAARAAPDRRADFGAEVATWYPLRVIMAILGVPLEDLPMMHRLTKSLTAPQDPDVAGADASGESIFDSIPIFTEYFLELIADRRRAPRDDLATVIANGQVDGKPMGELETVSYLITMAVAGHDTTAASMAAGMQQFALNPDQWAALRARPELARTAGDEMIRWQTPIKHFMRSISADTELGGVPMRAGQAITMYYLSANFDESVFGDPYRFRIDRAPNRHLAFGHGSHVCMGLGLARLEIASLFAELARRVQTIEPAGPVDPIVTNFIGGFKSVPVSLTPTVC